MIGNGISMGQFPVLQNDLHLGAIPDARLQSLAGGFEQVGAGAPERGALLGERLPSFSAIDPQFALQARQGALQNAYYNPAMAGGLPAQSFEPLHHHMADPAALSGQLSQMAGPGTAQGESMQQRVEEMKKRLEQEHGGGAMGQLAQHPELAHPGGGMGGMEAIMGTQMALGGAEKIFHIGKGAYEMYQKSAKEKAAKAEKAGKEEPEFKGQKTDDKKDTKDADEAEDAEGSEDTEETQQTSRNNQEEDDDVDEVDEDDDMDDDDMDDDLGDDDELESGLDDVDDDIDESMDDVGDEVAEGAEDALEDI